jgi:hypothetical protein|tara:strand:- start:943 stop:1167 length:225 start_codon:yes stop_codon:yes gene_type:complete
MINSRQIVEIIKEEVNKTESALIKQALNKIVDRIEILEDLELNNMYKDYMQKEEQEREESVKRVKNEWDNIFSK